MVVFEQIPIPDADVRYLPHLPLGRTTDETMRRLLDEVPWRAEEIVMFGRKVMQPRLTAWYGDPGCVYSYAGIRLRPRPWSAILFDLKARIEAATAERFNSVLLNCYRDERDSIGFHSDDEPELGPRPVIASLSLGAERVFVMKHKTDRKLPPVRLVLASGSLLLMKGETQRCWRHGVPKTTRPCGKRVNLTFRCILRRGTESAR
ncbi:MAG TPA: alpha-ketoglutarate-dependent dioxygenase AlkB [Stellaceae bacterium]|nr:alpha-ketoglutarate-dependent dioxygenase AlkB [Stellaceae bacterium]